MVRPTGITLDKSRAEPLYKQIFDQIVERIHRGAYPPGHRLPPTRVLAGELDTHRNTVVRAYTDLETSGFVSSTVGRGTFVETMRPARTPPRRIETAPLPWASLVSNASNSEPLSRGRRFARSEAGRDVINLTRTQPSNDLLPHDLLRRCIDHVLRSQGPKALGYAPPDGLPRLRQLIAEDLALQGVPAKADDVVVTTGSQQGLDLIARALVNPGDTFLVDRTTYVGAINLLTTAGARLMPVPTDDDGPDISFLTRLGRGAAKGLYLMPNCQNPTGASVSAERRRALITWSHDAGVPLIEDDYGADLNLDDVPPPPSLRALDGDVIYTGTFSKRLVPALRVGFVLCPAGLRPAISTLKQAMDLGTSILLQHALAEFLERGYLRAHVGRIQPEYRARRDALESALRTHGPPGLTWKTPSRGVFLWLPLPAQLEPEVVFEEAHRRGVLVSPATMHAVDPRPPRGVRLTFCHESTARIYEGGKRLGEALRSLVRQRGPRSHEAPALEVV